MSSLVFLSKFEAKLARALGEAQLYREFRANKDETTGRIKKVLADHPWQVYEGSKPESGKRYYSSLSYPTAEAARGAFARECHQDVYARDGTPDGEILTKVLMQFDPAAMAGRVTAHGMGAIEAALLCVKSGGHIVASKFLFGTTKRNLTELQTTRGIHVTFVDGRDPNAFAAATHRNWTQAYILEPVGNPGMEPTDTENVSAIAHRPEYDIFVIADNSMTPFARVLSRGSDRPGPERDGAASDARQEGADMAAFSTTKVLGLGVDNGGALLVSQAGMERLERHFPGQSAGYPVLPYVSRMGLTQSHRGAHAMLGNAALSPLRVKRQTANATGLVTFLKTEYPELPIRSTALMADAPPGTMTSIFALQLGSQERAFRFIDILAAEGIGVVNNFGSAQTTVIHPSSTTQSALSLDEQKEQGIGQDLVRVSVGIEPLAFLKRRLKNAYEKSGCSLG